MTNCSEKVKVFDKNKPKTTGVNKVDTEEIVCKVLI